MNEVIIKELRSKVFIDADVAIGMGKPPGNWIFQRLLDLVNVGLISIVTTDLTIGQVVKHHVDDAYKTLAPLRESRFRDLVSNTLGIDLPRKSNANWRQSLKTQYENEVSEMFNKLKAETISLDQVTPSKIFSDYISGSGFFNPKNKPDQFADAFVFSAVVENANSDNPLVIVARDNDFKEPAKETPGVVLLKSIEELFAWFALEIKAPDLPNINEFLKHGLVSNELFKQEVELEDLELDNDWVIDAHINDVAIENVSAFELFHDDIVIAMVDVKVELAVGYRSHDSYRYETELHPRSEIADIALFAALDFEEGVPVAIQEVKLREYVLWFNQPMSNTVRIQFHYD